MLTPKLLTFCLLTVTMCSPLVWSRNVREAKAEYDEEAARKYLDKIDVEGSIKTTQGVTADWGYDSNITDANLQHKLEVSSANAKYTKETWEETIKYPWQSFKDPLIKRQFQKYSVLGSAALPPAKYEELNRDVNDMAGIYAKATVCDYQNRTKCDLYLEPEITERLIASRDPEELKWLWVQWRNESGRNCRKLFEDYVKLSNEAAVLNNFTDTSEYWLRDYEAADIREQFEEQWQRVRPLYLQLHAYVRRRLREQYGEEVVSKRGPIPAHLLGNMWAQAWGNILNFSVPFANKPSTDVTPAMIAQGYTPLKMFKLAEEFFVSLNLSAMPQKFWDNSIIERPNDGRDLVCHASAWDFYDGEDFRIKQCTVVNMDELNTVHHEMGHVQYYLQYKDQPLCFKEGANEGFHEAVGDVIALSVSTPKHMRKIGLLDTTEDDEQTDINQLFSMALDKIAFLPFGYLMDQWRWKVFKNNISSDDYNCRWWDLRESYQGLEPPVDRSEDDFDPGAKYHIIADVPYIRYFVSFIVQFQFHRALCIEAGEFDPNDPSKPLHQCDIYQSTKAGNLLGKMLQMGSSQPWPDAMEALTGQRKMDAGALLQYFKVLQDWLEKENKRTGEYIGWEPTKRVCKHSKTASTGHGFYAKPSCTTLRRYKRTTVIADKQEFDDDEEESEGEEFDEMKRKTRKKSKESIRKYEAMNSDQDLRARRRKFWRTNSYERRLPNNVEIVNRGISKERGRRQYKKSEKGGGIKNVRGKVTGSNHYGTKQLNKESKYEHKQKFGDNRYYPKTTAGQESLEAIYKNIMSDSNRALVQAEEELKKIDKISFVGGPNTHKTRNARKIYGRDRMAKTRSNSLRDDSGCSHFEIDFETMKLLLNKLLCSEKNFVNGRMDDECPAERGDSNRRRQASMVAVLDLQGRKQMPQNEHCCFPQIVSNLNNGQGYKRSQIRSGVSNNRINEPKWSIVTWEGDSFDRRQRKTYEDDEEEWSEAPNLSNARIVPKNQYQEVLGQFGVNCLDSNRFNSFQRSGRSLYKRRCGNRYKLDPNKNKLGLLLYFEEDDPEMDPLLPFLQSLHVENGFGGMCMPELQFKTGSCPKWNRNKVCSHLNVDNFDEWTRGRKNEPSVEELKAPMMDEKRQPHRKNNKIRKKVTFETFDENS